jgi:beta-hydroxylase
MNVVRSLAFKFERVAKSLPGHASDVFPMGHYAATRELEENWREIRRELLAVMNDVEVIPPNQSLDERQLQLVAGKADKDWRIYYLYGWGRKIELNCKQCPVTGRLLSRVPGIVNANFSILAPRKHIPPHRGLFGGILRYHLGLIVPGPAGACRLRVGNDVVPWQEGVGFAWDNGCNHEAWNDTDEVRVVLLVDFVRPLPQPFALANSLFVHYFARRPFVYRTQAEGIRWYIARNPEYRTIGDAVLNGKIGVAEAASRWGVNVKAVRLWLQGVQQSAGAVAQPS